jgi:hypothetical protein
MRLGLCCGNFLRREDEGPAAKGAEEAEEAKSRIEVSDAEFSAGLRERKTIRGG